MKNQIEPNINGAVQAQNTAVNPASWKVPNRAPNSAELQAVKTDSATVDEKASKQQTESMARTLRMGTAPVGRLLLEFSIPAIISMVFNSLYNIVDTAFLGIAVGKVGVAVTTLALPVMMILMGFATMAGQGGNALGAIQLGRGETEKVEKTLGNTAFMLLFLAILVAIASHLVIDPVLVLIGTGEETYEPTKTFVQIICSGFVFQALGMGLNNFLRTMGKPNLALGTMVFGTTMCIIFNYLFVLHWNWGIAGSGYATILGQGCGMVPVLYFICWSKQASFHLRLRNLKPDIRLMWKIIVLGTASFLMQAAFTVTSVVLNQALTYYGRQDAVGEAGALAAVGVAQKVCMFAITPLIGINMGAQPLLGYNYGARNWQRLLTTMKLGIIGATVMSTAFFVIAHIFPSQLVALFGVYGPLEEFAIYCLKINTLFFPFVGMQIFGSGYFQASGQPLKATILTLTRQIIFLLPLYLFLPILLHRIFGLSGLHGLIISIPTADALSIMVTMTVVWKEIGKLRRLRAEEGPLGFHEREVLSQQAEASD